tara:strand:+ start:207 stop:1433 length:1227 start_codon:yes stop_codon:yes gene_type:complete
MPKILITGNGFDLYHGLPTTYNDFMWFIENFEAHQLKFEAYIESKNKKRLSNICIKKIDDKSLFKINSISAKNVWYKYFKNEKNIDSWIDFENAIEKVIIILNGFIEISEKKIFPYQFSNISFKLFPIKDFFNSYYEAEILASLKIISIYDNRFSINNKLIDIKSKEAISFNTSACIKILLNELDDFKSLFSIYLNSIVKQLYDQYEIQNHIPLDNIDYHFTFNYTETFKYLYKKIPTDHIHGKSSTGDGRNIVLGIDDNESLIKKNNEFMRFFKFYQTISLKTEYKFLYNLELVKPKPLNYIFFIWGHSLDRSDSTYINDLFDYVKSLVLKKASISKIVILYHNSESYKNLLINIFSLRGRKEIDDLIKKEDLIFLSLKNHRQKIKQLLSEDFDHFLSTEINFRNLL